MDDPIKTVSARPATLARTLLLLGLAALVSSCSSTQVTPLGPVPMEVTVDLQEAPYRVVATNAADLREEMDRLGPGSAWFRYRWRINWTYRYGAVDQPSINPAVSAETVCKLSDIKLTLRFTRTLPEWASRGSSTDALVTEWDDFMYAVRVHGEGHRDIAVAGAREIIRLLKDLQTPNCAFIQREARAIVEERIDEANKKDSAYHEATGGGREQGVRWPRSGRARTAARDEPS